MPNRGGKSKIGIAADHGGYEMKEKIHVLLTATGHKVMDFGNLEYDRDDDYPDFAIRLHALSHPESWSVASCCQS